MQVATTTTNTTPLQQGLNEVVVNKVQRMIDGKAVGARQAIQRLIHEGTIAQDYIAPLGVELKANDRHPVITFHHGEGLQMEMPDGIFSLNINAVSQLASKLGIPPQYLKGLCRGEAWKIELAAYLLNEHSTWTQRNRVLVRTVGSEVRGVLSDSYRRLNSVQILSAFIEEASNQGAVISDAYMNDTKVWAETILPSPITIPTAKNGDVVIFAGARFSTSDYGDGAVDMRTFLLNGVCLNGMVRQSVIKQVHLGAKLPDNMLLSEQTYELDTKATVSAIRDLTSGLFNKDTLLRKAYEIQGASEIEVDLEREIKGLTNRALLSKKEGEDVQKILMRNNPEDGVQGSATLWKLTQAITAHARELTPERSRELHEISGQLMNRVHLPA